MSVSVRQEAQQPLDEVSEVAPGVLRLQLPISMPGLGHVNCYLLEDENGFAVVDPGLPGDEPWAALKAGLHRAGVPLARVHTVVVTHSHPDHFGGAARLRDDAGSRIVTHRLFRLPYGPPADDDADIDPEQLANDDPSGRPLDADVVPGHFGKPTPWGGNPFMPVSLEQRDRVAEIWRNRRLPHPTHRVDDADQIMLARRPWVALHTPGHTVDHLCLYDAEHGVLLSGDHVLPTITPHISGLIPNTDPLDDYVDSLRRVAQLPKISTVLPAHGLAFGGLADRVEDIIEHHRGRLERLAEASKELGRAGTVGDYMKFLFRERSWGSMAESETFAHLEHLRHEGLAISAWHDNEMTFVVPPIPAGATLVADDPTGDHDTDDHDHAGHDHRHH